MSKFERLQPQRKFRLPDEMPSEIDPLDSDSVSGLVIARLQSGIESLASDVRIVRLVANPGVSGMIQGMFSAFIDRADGRLREFDPLDQPDAILGLAVITRVFILCGPDEIPPLYDASIEINWDNDDLVELATHRFGKQPASMPRPIFAGSADLILRTSQTVEQFDRLIAQYAGFWVKVDAERSTEIADRSAGRGTTSADRAAFKGQHVELHRPTRPLVSELHGYGKAAQWARDVAADIAAFRKGEIDWQDVDRGCVLHGPPGTGKTLFAQALAAECSIPVIYTSYATWSSVGEGHMGYVTKAIRASFTVAAENAPCLIFIDELDTIVGRGSGGMRDDWWSTITTTLLEQLDGALRTAGVIVVGATNHLAVIDEAMLRSGRLDRSFEIGLPDEQALRGILRSHFVGIDDATLETVATGLAGTVSGADIARLARECRRIARKENRPIDAELIIARAFPEETRSASFLRRIAIHEAGHAVLARLAGERVEVVSLIGGDSSQGYVRRARSEIDQTMASLDRLVVPILGGRAAELVSIGNCSAGAASDLERATAVIGSAQTGGLGPWLSSGEPEREMIELRLRRLNGEAMLLALQYRSKIEALADFLLDQRVLSGETLDDFFRRHDI
ncbi:AAA family ATPase [Aurantimonas coralicida]|uniref:AAA family ATPase n=1 Tax=Aurantimonas coralicida TaxID=182270 RepID=UPI001E319239|nr:AAA family ATPase [Aurantimonas coralicida]MCD1645363.1 AAA family ATPase [Aurantimonas coralicida]